MGDNRGKGLVFMRKILSIGMLVCLLAGMVLPAAAEGTPTLCVKTGDTYSVDTLTVPQGLTRTFSFYTTEDNTAYEAVTASLTSDNGAVAAISGTGNPFSVQGLTKGEASIVLAGAEGNALTTTIRVDVPESALEIRKAGGSWGTSLSGIQVNEDVEVELRLGADGVYDDCTSLAVASEGLTFSGGMLKAASAGTYSLRVDGYEVSVTIVPAPTQEVTLSKSDLGKLADQTQFDQFLADSHYSGSGDLTLLLPPGEIAEAITCNVSYSKGRLILKGQGAGNNKTNLKGGIRVSVQNVALDSMTLSGAPSVIVDPGCDLAVSNCNFKGSGYSFQLNQSTDGSVARLTLADNTFGSNRMVTIMDGDQEIGRWLADPGTDEHEETIDFGAVIDQEKTGDRVNALRITFPGSKTAYVNRDWAFSFITGCDFPDAYAVYGGKKAVSKLDKAQKEITIAGQYAGPYIIVNDAYPKLTDKKTYYELSVTENHKKYLTEITLDSFPYAAAAITKDGKTVDFSMKVTGSTRSATIPKVTAGTYTIKETTKTVTKTTSRTYRYTAQDFFLVTPAGFDNAMRAVKDNLVTLNCTEAGRKAVSLPVDSMAKAAEKGYQVLVKTKNAELTLDGAALKSLVQQARGTTVLLHYQSLNHKTLTSVGQTSVKSHLAQFPNDCADLAFLVTATSDGETIEDLQQGVITLRIPFIVLPGAEDKENVTYALQGESLSEARQTVVADGYLTTKLLDLTEHMVFQVGEPVETTEETTEETTVPDTEPETQPVTEPMTEPTQAPEPEAPAKKGAPWAAIAVVVLLAGGGAAAWFLFRRKRASR